VAAARGLRARGAIVTGTPMPTSVDISQSAAVAATRNGWGAAILASLRENSPIIAAVALYVAYADGLSVLMGTPHRSFDRLADSYEIFTAICAAAFTLAFVVWIVHLSLVRKIRLQTGEAWRRVGTEFFSRDRIPLAQPFHLDQMLYEMDHLIHLGNDPWTLLQPLLGYPFVTYMVDKAYALWVFVMYFAILLQITATNDRVRRQQFILSSVLAWTIIGGLGAILLSSAGPCYFGHLVGGTDPYAGLMTYLHSVKQFNVPFTDQPLHLIAVFVQDILWTDYVAGDFGFGRGISAAPSMHVASTWLVARMLSTYGRRCAILAWTFLGCIFIGSIHLGWHYAIDGYLGMLGAWGIWRVVGWWLKRPRVQAFLWPQGLSAKA
jgi:hypothetical protein